MQPSWPPAPKAKPFWLLRLEPWGRSLQSTLHPFPFFTHLIQSISRSLGPAQSWNLLLSTALLPPGPSPWHGSLNHSLLTIQHCLHQQCNKALCWEQYQFYQTMFQAFILWLLSNYAPRGLEPEQLGKWSHKVLKSEERYRETRKVYSEVFSGYWNGREFKLLFSIFAFFIIF